MLLQLKFIHYLPGLQINLTVTTSPYQSTLDKILGGTEIIKWDYFLKSPRALTTCHGGEHILTHKRDELNNFWAANANTTRGWRLFSAHLRTAQTTQTTKPPPLLFRQENVSQSSSKIFTLCSEHKQASWGLCSKGWDTPSMMSPLGNMPLIQMVSSLEEQNCQLRPFQIQNPVGPSLPPLVWENPSDSSLLFWKHKIRWYRISLGVERNQEKSASRI